MVYTPHRLVGHPACHAGIESELLQTPQYEVQQQVSLFARAIIMCAAAVVCIPEAIFHTAA